MARPRLFGVTYRMFGSVAKAEDVVQDVWTRWQSTEHGVVQNPQAFLTTTATRLGINVLHGGGLIRAAQKPVVRREQVAKYIATIAPSGWSGLTITVIQANGRASARLSRTGVVVMLVTIEASLEGIDQIIWVMRPSKLSVATSSPPHDYTDPADLDPDRHFKLRKS